jgi:uncharacterized protein YbjQ (UPF0145 family)
LAPAGVYHQFVTSYIEGFSHFVASMTAPVASGWSGWPGGACTHWTMQTLGQCFGVVVRSRGLGGNVMAGLRSIVGGEIHEYTQLLEEARRHALDRLVQNATAMGANAVLMMRYDSAEIGNTMSEIVAYGTAAVIERTP